MKHKNTTLSEQFQNPTGKSCKKREIKRDYNKKNKILPLLGNSIRRGLPVGKRILQ